MIRQTSRSRAVRALVALVGACGMLPMTAQAAVVTAFDWGSPSAGKAFYVFMTDVPFAECRVHIRDVTAGTPWVLVNTIPGGAGGSGARNGLVSGHFYQFRLAIKWTPVAPPALSFSNVFPVL